MLRKISGVLALLALASQAHAVPINVVFDGTIDRAVGHFDPNTGTGDGYGLATVGDLISGSFGFDSDTGIASYFNATIGSNVLTASNLVLSSHSDSFVSYFAIQGDLGNGLLMGLGLTNGSPVYNTAFPTSLTSADWLLSALTITHFPNFPVENGVDIAEGIRAGGLTSDGNLELHTVAASSVPEPGMLGLALVAVGAALFGMRRRMVAALR